LEAIKEDGKELPIDSVVKTPSRCQPVIGNILQPNYEYSRRRVFPDFMFVNLVYKMGHENQSRD